MITLAPIKYRKILKQDGGPIARLTDRERKIRKNESGYEAYAFLDDKLVDIPPKYTIYGNAHGTGSGESRDDAVNRAISEAIERWAYHETFNSTPRKYGFDIDPTSAGMAAFPGFLGLRARKAAYYEAVERWALREWWSGKLPCRDYHFLQQLGINTLEIQTPFHDVKVVVLFRESAKFKFVSYGFAAHKSLEKAAYKAQIEEHRNYLLLEDVCLQKDEYNNPNTTIEERRLLYFSSPPGHNMFLDMARRASRISGDYIQEKPKKLVDKKVKGPWSKYASVHRVLFQTSTSTYLNDDVRFFCF